MGTIGVSDTDAVECLLERQQDHQKQKPTQISQTTPYLILRGHSYIAQLPNILSWDSLALATQSLLDSAIWNLTSETPTLSGSDVLPFSSRMGSAESSPSKKHVCISSGFIQSSFGSLSRSRASAPEVSYSGSCTQTCLHQWPMPLSKESTGDCEIMSCQVWKSSWIERNWYTLLISQTHEHVELVGVQH